MNNYWKNTNKEIEEADKAAEQYAEELKNQKPSDAFGMGVDDDGY